MTKMQKRWLGLAAARLGQLSSGRLMLWLAASTAVLLIISGLGLGPRVARSAAPAGVVELRTAIASAGSPETAADDKLATTLALPALAPSLPLDDDGRVLLSLRFDRPQSAGPDDLLAAYLAGSCGSIGVHLNGNALQRNDEPAEAWAQLCPRPQLIPLPAALLHERGNRLDIRLHGVRLSETTSVRRAAYVSPVWIGPLQQLQREQAIAEIRHVSLPRLTHFGLLVLGGIVLLLSRAGHNVNLLRLYGLMVLVWSAVLGMIVWADRLWLPAAVFDMLLVTLWTPTIALGSRLLLTQSGRQMPWLFRLLAAQAVVIPVGLLLAPAGFSFAWAAAWGCVLIIEALAVFAIYLAEHWQSQREEFWLGLATVTVGAAAWTVDALSTPAHLPPSIAAAWIAASPFGWAAMLAITGVRIVTNLNRALVATQASRSLLQARVLDVTAVVERNFAQLAEMRIVQMTERERKRIASDLHDDLGAKLLTIVHTCDDERIAALGREALDEMRLAVRGLSGRPTLLGDAVADWRAETVMRLGHCRTRLAWHSEARLADQMISARALVQITRILREAISNIVKHSKAAHCSISFVWSEGGFTMSIKDDGCGLPEGGARAMQAGHGLASMKQRAQQLDGNCEIVSQPGQGTEIRLNLPL